MARSEANVALSETVVNIEERAFSCNTKLTSINIPSTVEYIGGSAFEYCQSLTEIFIPRSVTKVDTHCFYESGQLTVYCEAKNKGSDWSSFWNIQNRPVIWSAKK